MSALCRFHGVDREHAQHIDPLAVLAGRGIDLCIHGGFQFSLGVSRIVVCYWARRFKSISRRIIGVRMNCIARPIFPPGTTMVFGLLMNESCSIDSRYGKSMPLDWRSG